MKNQCLILILILSVYLTSCGGGRKSISTEECADTTLNTELSDNSTFADYTSHFNVIQLPIVLHPCDIDVKSMGLYEFDINEYKNYSPDGYSAAFGVIPTNNYIALILLNYADCYLPSLHTYTHNGEKIDSALLAIATSGGTDLGYQSVMYTQINENFTFYVCDSISTWQTDSLFEELPETRKEYIVYFTGQVLENGKIKLSAEQKKHLIKPKIKQ